MNRRVSILIILILVVAGCGRSAPPSAASSSKTSTTGATSSAASSAAAQKPTQEAGNFPDPCTLLSDDDVIQLTGRDITQIDRDGADTTASTRYCQWQQSSGQLAVVLSHTTSSDFKAAQEGTPSVAGIGEGAYWRGGHLYVLTGKTEIDVYSRSMDDKRSQEESSRIATVLIPKVQPFS
jgi:hypothetical protein